MTSTTTNITIRMDADVKARAESLFEEFGMTMSTAFNVFVRQALREGRIPFDIALTNPNSDTASAMREAERIAKDPAVKGYHDMDNLLADLKA